MIIAEMAARIELTLAALPATHRARIETEGERAVAEVLRQVCERDAERARAGRPAGTAGAPPSP